jgi:hypothetical protein
MNKAPSHGVRRLLRGTHPEIRKMLLIADEQNFKIKPTANRHFLVGAPDKDSDSDSGGWATIPRIPGGRHGTANARAQLRRIGVQFTR